MACCGWFPEVEVVGFRMVRGMGLLGAILEAGEGLKVREKKEVFGGEKFTL